MMNLRPIKLSVICGALIVATMGCGPDDSTEQTTSSTSQTTATGTTTTATGTSTTATGTTTTATGTSTTSTTSTGTTDTTSTTIDTTKLYGTAPDKAVPAPKFTVYNHESEERTRADLLGHPTVIWFFPAAGTSG
jgi:hypothetical protein